MSLLKQQRSWSETDLELALRWIRENRWSPGSLMDRWARLVVENAEREKRGQVEMFGESAA